MSIIIEIADAVKDALETGRDGPPDDGDPYTDELPTLSQTFTVDRSYVPVEEVDNLVDLSLRVMPSTLTAAILTRRPSYRRTYVIHIGIAQRADRDRTNEFLDPLMTFAEEVLDLFLQGAGHRLTLASGIEACCIAGENAPIYSPDHLDEKRAFVSLIALTFELER